MQKSQLPKFSELITALAELYDKQMSAPLIDLYWASLKDYPLEKVQDAVVNIIRTHKYPTMPKPAEFIEFINPPEDADAKAELALEEFFDRFVDSGYHSFNWTDPVLAMTVEHLGGWRSVLDTYPRSNEREAKFWLIEFKKTYKIFLKNPRHPKMKFIGSFEANNTAQGFLTDERGELIGLPGGGYIMLNSPEAQNYIENKGQKLIASEPDGTAY
jgi:hypothetical protein